MGSHPDWKGGPCLRQAPFETDFPSRAFVPAPQLQIQNCNSRWQTKLSKTGTAKRANERDAAGRKLAKTNMNAAVRRFPPMRIVCWNYDRHALCGQHVTSVITTNDRLSGCTIVLRATFDWIPIVRANMGRRRERATEDQNEKTEPHRCFGPQ